MENPHIINRFILLVLLIYIVVVVCLSIYFLSFQLFLGCLLPLVLLSGIFVVISLIQGIFFIPAVWLMGYLQSKGEREKDIQQSTLLFSKDALAILNRQVYDPAAKCDYEILSGGLLWCDEFPKFGSSEWWVIADGYVYRFLLASRALITLGEENTTFRHVWEQVLRYAPHWPGLREERRGEQARERLKMEREQFDQYLRHLEDHPEEIL